MARDQDPSRPWTPRLLKLFEEVHNHIYANEGLPKDVAFREVVKVLACKVLDERSGRGAFFLLEGERSQVERGEEGSFGARMRALCEALGEAYPSLFPKEEGLRLSPRTLALLVRKLQGLRLSRLEADAVGEAFQALYRKYHRGDRGEFYTPQPVAELAVRLLEPRPGERVVDPAAGSGGFLLEVLRFLARRYPGSDPGGQVTAIEFNPGVAAAAKLNFLLAGADGAQVLVGDALRLGLELEGSFDLVATNPPFGTRGRVDDRALLLRYDLGHRWEEGGGKWRKGETQTVEK